MSKKEWNSSHLSNPKLLNTLTRSVKMWSIFTKMAQAQRIEEIFLQEWAPQPSTPKMRNFIIWSLIKMFLWKETGGLLKSYSLKKVLWEKRMDLGNNKKEKKFMLRKILHPESGNMILKRVLGRVWVNQESNIRLQEPQTEVIPRNGQTLQTTLVVK